MSDYSYAYACLTCRRSFKRPGGWEAPNFRPCPRCGAPAQNLGRHFKAPKTDDLDQWAKVSFLVRNGFPFQPIHDPETHVRVRYPRTLQEAKRFVKKYAGLAIRVGRPQNKEMQLTRSAPAQSRGPRS